MHITEISVANYRNLSTFNLKLSCGLNVFVGQNAQGKTNLLEAIYLCCLGKSPRANNDKELINWNAETAKTAIKFESAFGSGDIKITLSKKAKKQVSVNSVPITRLGELLGYVNAIYFSPDEMRVIKQGPNERRRFLDIDLCQLDKMYFYSLNRFNKALAQRNNLLKNNRNSPMLRDMLEAWDQGIVRDGARVLLKRRAFVEKLSVHVKTVHEKLSSGSENFIISYDSQISGATLDDIQKNYANLLVNNFDKDLKLGYTSGGIQRDDISLDINGIDLRVYASQGQQRTAALSLKLAELDLFFQLTGEYPILLLDDVLSELDQKRQSQLLNFNDQVQVILTGTRFDEDLANKKYMRFSIADGKVLA